jgi:hypothetical protein
MKKLMFIMSCAAVVAAMASCKDNTYREAKQMMDEPFKQEREFLSDAVRHHSPDV